MPTEVRTRADRGTQHISLACGRTRGDSGLVVILGARSDAHDHSACESFISTPEIELINRQHIQSRDQARLAVFQHIEAFSTLANAIRRSATALRSRTRR